MPAPKYDWLIISKEFIQGIPIKDMESGKITIRFPTHQDLCDKYGCSLQTIRLRSQDEKWYLQRSQFKRKLKIKNSQINLEDLVGESAKFDGLHLASLEKVQKLIDSFLEPYLRQIENGDLNDNEEIEVKPLTTRDLKDITTMIKDSHQTVRSILGEQSVSSLLEDIKEETVSQRKIKTVSKSRLKELTKQLTDAEKIKEELELRKEMVKEQLAKVKHEED